ncbi:MAG: hypothetical protein ACPGSD_07820 [Flavobacteriales bacterium]
MKEIISPVTSFLQARKTPFFTVYIYVWVIRNWELLMKLIFIDCPDSLQHRIDFINNAYPSINFFIWNLLINVTLTLLLIVITFFILAIARFITDYYQFTIVPEIRHRLDKIGSTHILKESIQPLKDELEIVKNDLEYERQSNVRLTERNKDLEDQISQKHEELLKLSEKNIIDSAGLESRKKVMEYRNLQGEVELLTTKNNELNEQLEEYIVIHSKQIAEEISKTKTGLSLLEYSRLDSPFIIKDYHSDVYSELITNKLIEKTSTSVHGENLLFGKLTELGTLVVKELENSFPFHG